MTRSQITFVILILIVGSGIYFMKKLNIDSSEREFVITETGMPTSLDPLDADSTQNLPVARMLYATPLEISLENELTSSILKEFKYVPHSREIHWSLKDNLKFSDGSSMTAEDVAFSVSRMAFTRPKFPVVENILGLHDWLQRANPLETFPKGIELRGNEIVIKLDKPLQHPLFRFCLELFSVIPKKCVDLKNNKLSCEKVPSSGPYIISRKDESSIKFELRTDFSESKMPKVIKFSYIPATEIADRLESLSDEAVVSANEAMLNAKDFSAIELKSSTRFLPAARMAIFLLNPKTVLFKDQKCRWVFAQDLRDEYSKVQKLHALESSVFTKIIPGYLTNDELLLKSSHKQVDQDACRSLIQTAGLKWGYAKGEANEGFVLATQQIIQKYKIQSAPKEFASRKELYQAFENGEVDLMTVGTGFWALDPLGDLKMLFTPKLHKILAHISEDQNLQKLISEVSETESTEGLAKVNQYLYDQALFNVFSHVRRFYFSKGETVLSEVPFAITSPAPWQVFGQ